MSRSRDPRKGERGHLMVALMAGVAIMVIFSGVAFMAWSEVLRRDNEAEMIFRAQEIVRAIQRYRQDHSGMAPIKLEDLMEPGPIKGQYYLRRLYTDPLVPDGKWGLVFVAPGGGIYDPNLPQPLEGEEGLGGGSLFDDGQRGGPRGLGQGKRGGRGQQGMQGNNGNRGPGPSGLQGDPEQPGAPNQTGIGGLANPGSGDSTGLPIAGVKSLCTKDPFRVYNGLTRYSEWLFTYFDLESQMLGDRPNSKAKPGELPGIGNGGIRPGGGRRNTPGVERGRGPKPAPPLTDPAVVPEPRVPPRN